MSPVEVWLARKNIAVTCCVFHEDESSHYVTLRSLDMRGAQREITTALKSQGYTPVGRWRYVGGSSTTGFTECRRLFRAGSPT
jgi:hypothetical protein